LQKTLDILTSDKPKTGPTLAEILSTTKNQDSRPIYDTFNKDNYDYILTLLEKAQSNDELRTGLVSEINKAADVFIAINNYTNQTRHANPPSL
jgi:hypothetical protein